MKLSLVGSVLFCATLTLPITLAADETRKPDRTAEKETVAAAAAKWAEAFGDEKPDRILALYDKEAVLWGTLSPKRRDSAEAIRDYMTTAFAALPGHKVSFGDQLIRIYGDTAINTGYYTFSFSKDGESKTLPARYSFVYVKRNGRWMIVDHHSSAVPAPPK
jgi:uncharacterized protein (TIGR02246 family)